MTGIPGARGLITALLLLLSIWTMRQVSIEWPMVAAATLIPLGVVALACRRWVWPRPISA